MILSRITTVILIFLVLIISVSFRNTELISYAQREQPSISGGSRMSTPELGGPSVTANYALTEKILTEATPDEIKSFPFNDISPEELVVILTNISIPTLGKILGNISDGDLVQIFNKLPQDKSQQIIDRLPQDKSQQIIDRITRQSPK